MFIITSRGCSQSQNGNQQLTAGPPKLIHLYLNLTKPQNISVHLQGKARF